MDRKQYRVRPFVDADYEALSRFRTITSPELPSTPEEERAWDDAIAAPHLVNEKWVVEERETRTVVGLAAINHSPFSYEPHHFWASVTVDPAHRGRGIGRALSALLESEAASHHATRFWTTVRKDNPNGIEFARKQGFVELRTMWMSTLDLSAVEVPSPSEDVGALVLEGVRFTTLAEEGPARPEVRRHLFDLISEASRDVPQMGEYTPISFEQFVKQLESPQLLPEAYFLARYGEAYVAMSDLERDMAQADSLMVAFTGTRPAYRGRGIASELKRRGLEYAHRHGIRYLRTFNDSLNLPIASINDKLGFRRTVEWASLERRFPPEGAAAASGPVP